MQTAPYPDVSPDFGHWLAGFVDGEGSFWIGRMKTSYQPRFMIVLRADDAAILYECREQTGLGYVRKGHGKPTATRANSPQIEWHVMTKADCLGLVKLFDRYPLRAKKARDFAIWREAVLYWAPLKQRGGRGGGRSPHDWGPIPRLRDEIIAIKQFVTTV